MKALHKVNKASCRKLHVLGVMLFCVAGLCSSIKAAETNVVCRSCCLANVAPAAFTDKSLYQVESMWTSDAQKQVKLGELAGKPQVVLMFFSHCTTACPVLINDLQRIRAGLLPDERAAVGFTLVSLDPARDTPSALADYRKAWNLPADWTLLSGKNDDVLELAALLGIQYKPIGDGQYAHSNVITVLNAKGEIVHQQVGLSGDVGETVRQIQKILK
jgi:protein SCO1